MPLVQTDYGLIYNTDGTLCATLRPGEGRFGGAVAVEESTKNLVSNPITWEPTTNQYQTTVETDERLFGCVVSETVKLNNGTPASNLRTLIVAPGETYTASIYVKRVTQGGGSGFPRLIFYQPDTDQALASASATQNTGDWQRLVVTWTNDTDQEFEVRVYYYPTRKTGQITRQAAPQVEKRGFATSFVDGTRAAGRLMYPPEIINVQEGTFSAWVYVGDGLLQSHAYIFAFHDDTSTLLMLQRAASGILQAYVGKKIINSIEFSSLSQGWHHFALTWTTSQAVIYVDGEQLTVDSLSEPLPAPVNPRLAIGSHPTNNNRSLNSMIDELLILPYAADEQEIQSWYQNGITHVRKPGYYASFDDSLALQYWSEATYDYKVQNNRVIFERPPKDEDNILVFYETAVPNEDEAGS